MFERIALRNKNRYIVEFIWRSTTVRLVSLKWKCQGRVAEAEIEANHRAGSGWIEIRINQITTTEEEEIR